MTASQVDPESLSPKAGAKLLKKLGMGADQVEGGYAMRVIAAFATRLREGPEAVILRMLGLFDGPADPGAIAVLRAKPVIPWLTEPLMDLEEEDWQRAVSNLREQGLLLPADPGQPDVLDVHPLVRSFFREYLKSEQPEGWQAGNLRLAEFFQKKAPDLPAAGGIRPEE